ncbi:hypothetical protein [Neobacillus massiliamazoniensis]|nr:hypothetical protein [Neobacillus massiliamazoniensis]
MKKGVDEPCQSPKASIKHEKGVDKLSQWLRKSFYVPGFGENE